MSVLGQFQLRGDTAANWTSVNPILLAREIAIETDLLPNPLYKIGDGTTPWNMLPYGGLRGLPGIDGDDGRGIVSIARTTGTGAPGTTDTYTITYTFGPTSTFNVVNGADGRGVVSIARTSGTGAAGTTDTYTITYTTGPVSTFTVVNGANGRGITTIARTNGTGAAGTTDTYTITYTDATTSTFQVVNGANGSNGQSVAVLDEDSQLTAAATSINFRGPFKLTQVANAITVFAPRTYFDAEADFGFVGDLVTVDGAGSMTSGSNVLTSSVPVFTPTSVGKRITLARAGASSAQLTTTIASYVSATQVTLTASAGTTAPGRTFSFGTDNTAAITLMASTINALEYPGVVVQFGQTSTNAYGFPISVVLNKAVHARGVGGGYTADAGDYTKVGGTRLAWWGTSHDGGVAFQGFWNFAPTGAQALKRPSFKDCWIDCRNGDQNEALFGVKLLSAQGWKFEDFAVIDALAASVYCNITTAPTEARDTTRFRMCDVSFRQLDGRLGHNIIAPPTVTSAAAALTTTPQSVTLNSAASISADSRYVWIMSNLGYYVLCNVTGGVGTTTLTGVTTMAEYAVNAPTTFVGGNVIDTSPSTAAAMILDGGTGANTCCGTFQQLQISHGSTWGPAAIECINSDSLEFLSVFINGGNNTNDGAGNRIRKPGVRQNGSNTSVSLAARNNTFRGGDPGAGGISCMASLNTGVRMAFPSGPTYWDLLQLGNGAPVPTVEPGASFDWNPNGGLRPGIKSSATVADQAIAAATNTMILGTVCAVPPQGFQQGTTFKFTAIGVGTNASGTAANVIRVYLGPNGTIADTAIHTFTTGFGTASSTPFQIEVFVTMRLGPNAAATSSGRAVVLNSAAAGFINATSNVLTSTAATANTVTSGLLYIGLALQTGASKTVAITQAFCEVLNAANP